MEIDLETSNQLRDEHWSGEKGSTDQSLPKSRLYCLTVPDAEERIECTGYQLLDEFWEAFEGINPFEGINLIENETIEVPRFHQPSIGP